MIRNVIALGGQGFLKECLLYLLEDHNINVKGFLGIDNFKPCIESFNVKFLGFFENYKIQENDYFVICTGDVNLRKEYYNRLKNLNAKFYNLIYNSHLNDKYVSVGEANIIVNSFLTANIKIGNGNIINSGATIGHDVEIENFNFIAPNVQLLGHSKIGSVNSIGTSTCVLPRAVIQDCNIIAPCSCIYKKCKTNGYYSGNPAVRVGEV